MTQPLAFGRKLPLNEDRNARYRASHREEIAVRNRAWRATHRQERNAYNRVWKASRPAVIEVYVVYGPGTEVIYVGRTADFAYRMGTHKYDVSPWLAEMVSIVHRYHPTFGDSLVDEALLIRLHQPKYNLDGVIR